MKLDVSTELARLLVYIADVATAIRLNSPYRSDYQNRNPREVGLDVMWLSDSLHCLDQLGRALQSDNAHTVIEACDDLLKYYRMFTDGVQGDGLTGDPKATFERYGHLGNPRVAMTVFASIRAKAEASLDVGKLVDSFYKDVLGAVFSGVDDVDADGSCPPATPEELAALDAQIASEQFQPPQA